MERGQGWLQVKRASPMPVAAYFVAKIANAVVFATIIALILLAVGIGIRRRAPRSWPGAKADRPFSWLEQFRSARWAWRLATSPSQTPRLRWSTSSYLPMSFCSGLWIPIFMLPHVLQQVAKVLPPYHVSQLALNVIHATPNPTASWPHVQALIGATLLFLGVAAYGYWRDEGEMYG